MVYAKGAAAAEKLNGWPGPNVGSGRFFCTAWRIAQSTLNFDCKKCTMNFERKMIFWQNVRLK